MGRLQGVRCRVSQALQFPSCSPSHGSLRHSDGCSPGHQRRQVPQQRQNPRCHPKHSPGYDPLWADQIRCQRTEPTPPHDYPDSRRAISRRLPTRHCRKQARDPGAAVVQAIEHSSMCAEPEYDDRGYDAVYEEFESPPMQKVRQEAYGKDIGQHSWVTVEELEEDIPRLRLARASRLLDLGCGPCGPLVFIVGRVGCHGSGVDLNAKAIAAGRARVAAHGLENLVTLHEADLNEPMPFDSGCFDAIISIDAVLHVRDRAQLFREVARILVPGGRFLFTDAAVITGSISDDEVRRRAFHGRTQFVPPGFNERTLELAGFRLVMCIDRTANLLKSAAGRLNARFNHRAEVERLEGNAYFAGHQQYLETVVGLAQRGALSRM